MSERVGVEQTPDIEAIADWLGAMDESRNVFDVTDEATTVINIDVETLAARFADRLAAAVREARAAELREAADAAETDDLPHGDGDWLDGACDTILWLRDRADRIAVDAPEDCWPGVDR